MLTSLLEHTICQDLHIDSVCENKLHTCAKGGSRLFYRDCTPALCAFPELVGFKPSIGSVEHSVFLVSRMSLKSSSLYFRKSYWLPDF